MVQSVNKPGGSLGIDVFRFEDGLVVGHWDVLQDEVAAQDTVAGNPMFTNPQAGRRA
ncbi:hypothetical protein [Streptomyces olivochromogenes]|uniref:Uncharacterized protein n=1 Tax=Streptomyces olivochromogenes TaxID=1963 RepID=A0A250VML4_STROL|nr:hypothetical protein [Streptomyces olivochromogenes]GAX55334.1 hypothetical protein SO3561_06889 [Streptomyces olivochromogenes]